MVVVKHLVSKAEKTVHASRLQSNSDKDLNVTIRLQEQIQHDEWMFIVESFKDFREQRKEYQFLTQWHRIDKPVWEPMDIMFQDFPKLPRAFLDSKTSLPHSDEIIRLYGCRCNNVRNNHFSSFPSGFGVVLGMHLRHFGHFLSL